MDDFLDCVELKLGSDDNAVSVEKSEDGTPHPTSTFELSEHAKASLASALNNPDMDLAANLHASAKSCRTNFFKFHWQLHKLLGEHQAVGIEPQGTCSCPCKQMQEVCGYGAQE
jgi:hypothetical protein